MQTPRAVGESMPGVDIDIRPSSLADGTATASSGLDANMTHEMAKAVPKPTPSALVDSSSAITPTAATALPTESNLVQSPAGHGRDRQSSEGDSQNVPSQRDIRDSPSIDPKAAALLTADDAVALPAAAIPGFVAQDDPRQPKVVHLPPRDQQERHLREVEHAVARRDRLLNEKATLSLGSGLGDLVSSPSSTVGPHSTTTPRPAQPSPDTSPDEESFPANITASGRNGSLSVYEEEMTKDEEHRILKSQMDEARRKARAGSPAMSDSQLRLEDEQAIKSAQDVTFTIANGDGVNAQDLISRNVLEPVQGAGKDASPPEVRPSTTTPGANSQSTPSYVDKMRDSVSKENLDAPLDMPDGDATTVEPKQPLGTSAQRYPSASPAGAEGSQRKDVEMGQNRADDLQNGFGDSQLVRDNERMSALNSSGLGGENAASGSVEDHSTQAIAQMFSELRHSGQRGSKRRRLSTVVFARQDHTRILDKMVRESEDYAALQGASQDPNRDYLEPLFSWQAHQSPRARPLLDVLQTANKTVSTENQHAAAEAVHEYRTLKKIYQMQSASRWSFRQLERSQEPPRPQSVWDNLLGQMKAMRTDFREERKWKHAVARKMAHWCADFVASSPRQRKLLQIKVRPNASSRRGPIESDRAAAVEAPALAESDMSGGLQDVPELIHSAANETESEWFPDDEGPGYMSGTAQPPVALFSLDDDDVILRLEDNAATNSLISELPLYEPKPLADIPLDGSESASAPAPAQPIVPVSKLVTGKIVPTIMGPPKKRSRYDYEEEGEAEGDSSTRQSFEDVWPSQGYHVGRQEIPPENTDVALFNKENQALRDRIHASHAFRPPAEFGMPPTSWFEAKTSSQWLWEEDQRLRALVREYSYNWSIISDRLAIPSLFTSAAERRTPWECFERWYLLEGLPADMLKTAYFRTYQSRLETAARSIAAQWQASQQQQAQTPGQGTPVRRRSSQPCRVERRRNNRYLALIDAMRKLARKRESIQHKQQEAAKAAALRKAHEGARPRNQTHTPQQFSQMKHEKETAIARSNQAMHQQRMLAMSHQRAMQQQGINGTNGPQQQPHNNPGVNGHGPSPLGNANVQPGHPQQGVNIQAQPHPTGQASQPNGAVPGVPLNPQGVPQANMQVNMRAGLQPQSSSDNLRIAMQQRAVQGAAGQPPYPIQRNMQGGMNGINRGGMPNPAMLAAMANNQHLSGNAVSANAAASATMNGTGIPRSSASPRMSNANPASRPQPLSSGHVPAINEISAHIQSQNPHMTPDEVRQLAIERLKSRTNSTRQNALNAAGGAAGLGSQQASQHMGAQSAYQQPQPPNHIHAGSASPRTRPSSSQQQLGQGSPGLSNATLGNGGVVGQGPRPESRSATPQGQMLMQGSPVMGQLQAAVPGSR
ncbi:RNA polymerase II transcription elongation factor SpEAF [Coniosporium tulheliwenetii]|uniref:RNA polymerase II transcription elongation factor SpEAF n=1 Tax=Coniosporium tulheliwenetii TaxID=3383036 RepID=A0ACC2ZC71_9PEZI|nr:RNA polymerase II transcription elongation factor SpEAF [Cladosporium sp. JES 115]